MLTLLPAPEITPIIGGVTCCLVFSFLCCVLCTVIFFLSHGGVSFFGEDGFKPSIPNGVDQSDIPLHHSFCFYSMENPPTNLTENDEMGRHK